MNNLRSQFLLRPDVAFLNHGSFGATPRPVFERYQKWQRELELEPVDLLGRRAPELLRQSRMELGQFLNADPDDLVYITNATTGVNIVARSLQLGAGDEVLTTNHEYGACDNIWRFLSGKQGFSYRAVEIPVPVTTHDDFLERFVAQITPQTRVIFISHITSPTGLTFPVPQLCQIARQRGIITVVDGAHVPGQLPLDLRELDADFYTGNLHKWLCAPKGAAFLYARRELQEQLEPLVISWGWNGPFSKGSQFLDYLEYGGTSDISAPLSVPAAIQFFGENDWPAVAEGCHQIVRQARPEIAAALDATPICPDDRQWFRQMSAFLLPEGLPGDLLHSRLFSEHLVEIPTFPWQGRWAIRIAVQGYNTWEDVERLLAGLREIRKTL